MNTKELLKIVENNGKSGREHQEFLYKNIFYLIDKRKLDFALNILKTNQKEFFNMKNLKKFFKDRELLSEEFLEFISIMHKEVEF